jgi:hypothetical protein
VFLPSAPFYAPPFLFSSQSFFVYFTFFSLTLNTKLFIPTEKGKGGKALEAIVKIISLRIIIEKLAFSLSSQIVSLFTPAAESHGLCPWMNASRHSSGDVAPLGRAVVPRAMPVGLHR